jgi:predicted dehydrogenase
MSASSLRVAIVGCGWIADEHLKAWRSMGAKVVALCDKDATLAKTKAEKWGVQRYYKDVSRMVDSEKIDVASICTPPNFRLSVIEPLVEKGVHVVIEKPFAMSIPEAEKVIELKNRYHVKLTVVHSWLFSHIMRRTMRFLASGEIGELLGFEMNMLHTKDDPMAANPSHWCHSMIAGRFGENLPHPLYISRAILGDVEVKQILGSKLGSYPWMPIDELRVLLGDKKGRIASIYISFNTARPETTLKIFGTTGILEVNLSNNILIKKHYREIKPIQVTIDVLRSIMDHVTSLSSIGLAILTRRYQGMHTEFIKEFVRSLKNDDEPPVTAEEALEVTKLHIELSSKIHKLYYE